jgi:hypothetical protein
MATLAKIGQIHSRHLLIEKPGGAGVGVVGKAEDTRLGHPGAMKFLAGPVSSTRWSQAAASRRKRRFRARPPKQPPHF